MSQLIDQVLSGRMVANGKMSSGRMTKSAPEPPILPTPSECARSPLITLLVGKDEMAFKVHEKILISRSDYFRDMLGSGPASVNLSAALNGVIKSTTDAKRSTSAHGHVYAQPDGDAMPDVQPTPRSPVKPEVKVEDPKDAKDINPSMNEKGARTISLPDDQVVAVKSFIDWAYSGNVSMSPEKEIFHLAIWLFADKVSEAYSNDFMDSYRAFYFNKSTYMNQSALRTMYAVGLRGSPLARFGLLTIVHASMKWPKQWVKEEGKPKRSNSITVTAGSEDEKESLHEWTNEPMLLLDYTQEVIKWQKRAGGDPSAMKGCVFHQHTRGSVCKAAVELK